MGSPIVKLYYVSPYATLPPGVGSAGVTLQTDPAQSPTPSTVNNAVLVIRLRTADDSIVIGISPTSGPGTGVISATYQPSLPLSATSSYMIDIIWVPSGTPPENIDWTTAVASAPVTAATVSLQSASFDGTTLTAQVAYGPSGIGVGAQVNVWSLSGGVYVNVGSGQQLGNIVSVPVTPGQYPPVFFLSAQAVIPATNTGGAGSFSAPFSQGPPTPISNNSGMPQTAQSFTAVNYNGKTLSLTWSLASQAGCVNPDSSLIQILSSNSQVIATFNGSPTSAIIPIDLNGQSGLTVKVSTVAGGIGSTPISSSLITQAPQVTNTASAGANTTATVTVPNNDSAQGWLMDGDTILSGPVTPTNNTLTFNYNSAGRVGLSVVASITASNGIISGPPSAPAVLLATIPSLIAASIYTSPADATKWCIAMEWERLPDHAEDIVSYTASFILNPTPVTATTTGASTLLSVPKSLVDATQPQSLQLSATGTSGSSPTLTLTALFAPPLLASLNTNGTQIAATWTAPSNIPSNNILPVTYHMVIAANSTVIFTGPPTLATSGAISLDNISIPSKGNISVMVNMSIGPVQLITDANMATNCSAIPILSAPVITPVTANPLTNLSTLNWAQVTGASGYTVNFTQGPSQPATSGTSLSLTNAVSLGSPLGYNVQATGTSNSVPVTGPPSPLAWVPANAANVGDVRFDGTNVMVEWDPVADAIAYTVTVYDNANPAKQYYTGTTSGTSTSFPITLGANTLVYSVYLQPITEAGTGLSAAALPLFSPGLFLSQQPAASAYPYLYTAGALSDLGTTAAGPAPRLLTLYLPELGAAPNALGTTAITMDPFTIQPSGNAALPYMLTIAADNTAWGFTTEAIRLSLQSAYVSFLKTIEKPTGNNPPPGITPYGISLVQAAIAAVLPQTFPEQLYYNFGLSTTSGSGAGYVDLRPGMVLRIMASDYINIPQNGLPSWINGYAGGTVLDLEIGSYTSGANWLTGFDGFLNTLSAGGALTVSPPALSSASYVQAGIAGAADLYFPQFIQPFYRLFFPGSLSTPWSNGSNATNANFALAAAPNYTSLQATTVDPTKNPTAYFRGRAIVEVMIRVQVDGNPRLVPVGTSLGQLLEQLGLRPAATSPLLDQVRVIRSLASVIASTTPSQAQAPLQEINIGWNGLQTYGMGTGSNALSLPLLCGDQVFTNS